MFELVSDLSDSVSGYLEKDELDSATVILFGVVIINALTWLGSLFWLLKWFLTNPETPETRNYPVKAADFLIVQDVAWVVGFSVILLIYAGITGFWIGLILSWWNVTHIIVMLFWRNSFVQF